MADDSTAPIQYYVVFPLVIRGVVSVIRAGRHRYGEDKT